MFGPPVPQSRTLQRSATSGDPNGSNVATWPAFTTGSGAHLELGANIMAGEGLHTAGAVLWDQFQAERRATN